MIKTQESRGTNSLLRRLLWFTHTHGQIMFASQCDGRATFGLFAKCMGSSFCSQSSPRVQRTNHIYVHKYTSIVPTIHTSNHNGEFIWLLFCLAFAMDAVSIQVYTPFNAFSAENMLLYEYFYLSCISSNIYMLPATKRIWRQQV